MPEYFFSTEKNLSQVLSYKKLFIRSAMDEYVW